MCAGYLKNMEKWDKPSLYWPILTFFWIIMFIYYIWFSDIMIFYLAIAGTILYLIGVYTRNHLRKKLN